MSELIERRFAGASAVAGRTVAVRATDKGRQIFGHAALWYNASDPGTQYTLMSSGGKPTLVERILPGAFSRSLRSGENIGAVWNHNSDIVLGATQSKTLRLAVDGVGLKFEVDAPDSLFANAAVTAISRGDVCGASFAFSVAEGGERFIISKDPMQPDVRELTDLTLYEISPTLFPAYGAASSNVRAGNDRDDVLRRWREIRAAKIGNGTAGAVTFAHDDNAVIRDDEWDEDSARSRVRSWASTGDGIDHSKMARAFAYSSGGASENSHVLLHHDIRSGRLHLHVGAVKRCLRMLDDMDDDDDAIPPDHRAAVRSHLERHLERAAENASDDDDDDDAGERERQRMRARLAEADAETRKLDFAAKRRQLAALEAELREGTCNVTYPVSPELWERAKAIHAKFWAFENKPL